MAPRVALCPAVVVSLAERQWDGSCGNLNKGAWQVSGNHTSRPLIGKCAARSTIAALTIGRAVLWPNTPDCRTWRSTTQSSKCWPAWSTGSAAARSRSLIIGRAISTLSALRIHVIGNCWPTSRQMAQKTSMLSLKFRLRPEVSCHIPLPGGSDLSPSTNLPRLWLSTLHLRDPRSRGMPRFCRKYGDCGRETALQDFDPGWTRRDLIP